MKKIKDFFARLFYNYKKSELYKHAKRELDILLWHCKNDKDAYKMQKELNKNLLKVVETFCKFHHSGGTAEYQLHNFSRIMHYLPLFPLDDTGDQWRKVESRGLKDTHYSKIIYQHKRYPGLFKELNISNSTGEIVSKTYQDIHHRDVDIKFPYYPKDIN